MSRQALDQARKVLADAGLADAALDARRLYRHVTGIDETRILTGELPVLSPDQHHALDSAIKRRLAHEPVSRIIGKRAFWKRSFEVTPATLDPRPATETLVEAALTIIERQGAPLSPKHLIDLGTGSGCILLSVLADASGWTGTGVDLCPDALTVANRNAASHGLRDRTRFVQGSWDAVDFAEASLILSNPPYIPTADIAELDPDVRDYDPSRALDGGTDGLDCYRAIAEACAKTARQHAAVLVMEIGAGQADDVRAIFSGPRFEPFRDPNVVTSDLQGHERIIIVNVV